MEQWESEPEHVLELLLQSVDSRTFLVRHLLVYLQHVRTLSACVMSYVKEGSLTSFSPKEKTGTRSALRDESSVEGRSMGGSRDVPVLNRELDEAKSTNVTAL